MQIILSQTQIDTFLYTPGVVEKMKTKEGWNRHGITYYHESIWNTQNLKPYSRYGNTEYIEEQ